MPAASGFDLSALQAAAQEGTAGLRRYRDAQTALSGSTQAATDQLLAGIQSRSGSGPSGQGYTQQVLNEALGRGTSALGSAGEVAGIRQSAAGGADAYLNQLNAADQAHAVDLGDQIRKASDTTLGRSQTLFDSDLAGKTTADDSQLASQRAALDLLLGRQSKAFDESQSLAQQKATTAQAVQDAATRSKYGGYQSAAEQQAAARGLGALLQQRVQAGLGKQQADAQFDQNQADMAYAAQEQARTRAATQSNEQGAYGAIKGMGQYLAPQVADNGRLTGLLAGLSQAKDAEGAHHSLDAYDTTQRAQQAVDAERAAIPQRGLAADQRQHQGVLDAQTYAGHTSGNQDTLAALQQLLDTPDSTYQQLGGVNVGLPPEVALGMFPSPSPADQLSQMLAQRNLSSFNETGMTYAEQQSALARQQAQALKDEQAQLDTSVSDATGGYDPNDLTNLSGLTESQVAKVVSAPGWSKPTDPSSPAIQDLVDLAIQKVLANDADGQTALTQLLSASDLTSQQKRLIRAQVQSATGLNPVSKQ
jgi:hypothetical protein